MRRYALIDVGLVNDLGDQLRAFVDGARVWRRQFAAEDGIFAAGGDQQTEQRPYAVHCEPEDDDGDENEYGDASAHGGGGCSAASFCTCFLSSGQGAECDQRSRARSRVEIGN